MSDEKPKPPFNPAWIGVAVLLIGQLIFIGGVYGSLNQQASNNAAEVVKLQAWQAATERRMAEADKQAAVTATQVASELRFMNANLDALRRSLESRGIPVQSPTASPP